MAGPYNVSDLVLYKDVSDIFLARIVKKRADYDENRRYLIQTINKSGTGREWNTELIDYVNEDSLHISGGVFDTSKSSFVSTLGRSAATDVREYMVNYFWDKFTYIGDNAKASKFIIKYILPSLGDWPPPLSGSGEGIRWGHNDSDNFYSLKIPGYDLWKKTYPS